MDYKYIEQLLDRYWACETSEEEERILKAFFSQKDVPAALARYKALFVYETEQCAASALGDDFDRRVMEAAGVADGAEAPAAGRVVSVHHITLGRRLRPLWRAAAAVAIVTLLGTAAQHSFMQPSATDQAAGWDYNQSAYKDSYQDPQKAYEASMRTLEMFKEGAQTAVNDSATHNAAGRAAKN